jgi:hypothetical protein
MHSGAGAVWLAWESGGGHRRVVLTPWARDILRTNVIPAELRDQFLQEYHHFLSGPAALAEQPHQVSYLNDRVRRAAS